MIDFHGGVIGIMGVIKILSEETQPLDDYGFNGGVISFGGVIVGDVIYCNDPLTNYGFIGGVFIEGIRQLVQVICRILSHRDIVIIILMGHFHGISLNSIRQLEMNTSFCQM